MKTRSFFLCTLASFFVCAATQISAQAALPTIDFITSYTIPDSTFDTYGLGINDDGTIVGLSRSNFRSQEQGFVRLRNGDYSVVMNPNEGIPFTVTTAINNSGVIAGYYDTGNHTINGFFLSGDTYTDFTVPDTCETYIFAINDAGDFAGQVRGGCNGSFRAFVSIGGNVTIFTVAGADDSGAAGMNNLGQVVGSYDQHGFLRNADGTLIFPIDYPGAVFTGLSGINDKGWMVGTYEDTEGTFHGLFMPSLTEFVVYDYEHGNEFSGINNRGYICGDYFDGENHGFLVRVRRSSGE